MKKYNSASDLNKRLSGIDILIIVEKERRDEFLIKYYHENKHVLVIKANNEGNIDNINSDINAFMIERNEVTGYSLVFIPAFGVKDAKYAIWADNELVGQKGVNTVGGILEFLPTNSIILNKIRTL